METNTCKALIVVPPKKINWEEQFNLPKSHAEILMWQRFYENMSSALTYMRVIGEKANANPIH